MSLLEWLKFWSKFFQNTPYSEVQFQNTPQKWKLSESSNPRVSEYPSNENCQRVQIWKFQNTPPPNENCQRVQIREFQNTPQMKIVRDFKSESFRIPPQMKIVRESKSESFRIPSKIKIVRESRSESFRIPPPELKLSESPNLRVSEYPPKIGKTSDFKLQNSLKIWEIYVETNL